MLASAGAQIARSSACSSRSLDITSCHLADTWPQSLSAPTGGASSAAGCVWSSALRAQGWCLASPTPPPRAGGASAAGSGLVGASGAPCAGRSGRTPTMVRGCGRIGYFLNADGAASGVGHGRFKPASAAPMPALAAHELGGGSAELSDDTRTSARIVASMLACVLPASRLGMPRTPPFDRFDACLSTFSAVPLCGHSDSAQVACILWGFGAAVAASRCSFTSAAAWADGGASRARCAALALAPLASAGSGAAVTGPMPQVGLMQPVPDAACCCTKCGSEASGDSGSPASLPAGGSMGTVLAGPLTAAKPTLVLSWYTGSRTIDQPGWPARCHAASAAACRRCSSSASGAGSSCTHGAPSCVLRLGSPAGLPKQTCPLVALNMSPAEPWASAYQTRKRESSYTVRSSTARRCFHLCSCLPFMPDSSCS
mmetsp:Transcript_42992/g.129059  ORF Transcript_42992/g.129059 Transcript_42992/m.129059 type:complete len:428 (+) Transcript_42992:255-1538(+)